ncbi:MFS transporter [Rubrobacter xylanophilus]|uniref:MFS transporter n=1 Tax=Rubrobacter xylanophilus TaxID=49319 RepID=UPI00003A25A8|nr:MFS transporter [Rubrobacter xylanophilus]
MWAWALYDFSNTIFSVSILSFFFPVWLGDELGAGAGAVNAAAALSAALVLLTAPAVGALADLRQRRVPYLAALTLLACGLTAALDAAGGVVVAVALFVAADLAYQSALVFYNALLPVVAAGRGAGRVSGYGTAAGYVGSIFALLVLTLFVARGEEARALLGPLGWWLEPGETGSNAFVPTAVLYLLFSLPAFFLVPDPRVREPRPGGLGRAYRDVISTVRSIRRYRGMAPFILATLLYTDAANTAIANMALYGREVFGMQSQDIRNLLLFSTLFAVAGSFGCGLLSDRWGPRRALMAVLVLWLAAILLAAGALSAWMLYVAGPLVGAALGGTWTAGRPMLVALSPPEKIGEFFGLYSFAGKVSAVAGPALTALLLFWLEELGTLAYRLSVGSLALVMVLAMAVLARVPDVRPAGVVDRYAPEVLVSRENGEVVR